MKSWVALFRGINVGGKNILPMAKLKHDLASLKLQHVRTYIQSGNVVFESSAKDAVALQKRIAACVKKEHGFAPHVLVFDSEFLSAAIDANPFQDALSEPKSLHFFFLAEKPMAAETSAIESARKDSESYRLIDRVFYLHAPDGIGRSQLASQAAKYLGVVATARNYRTVAKLQEMVDRSK